jgi:hypothetical protein
MKTLELNQMENIQGGGWVGCTFGIGASIGIFAVAATNPEIGVAFLMGGEGGYLYASVLASTIEACAN